MLKYRIRRIARIAKSLCFWIDKQLQAASKPDFTQFHPFKGTQEWEIFWLRFWILYYFIVSYVKILRFCKTNFLIGPVLEEVRFFRVVLGLRGMKKIFELGQKFFLIFLFMNPLYELLLVFLKFDPLTAPGMALCVNLGPKCQNLFCLVWD